MTKQQMLGQLAAMKEYFDRSTRVLEEADSTFAPAEGMFTAAQQVAHVAQTVEWFIAGVLAADGFDMDFERLDREVRQVTSLAAARAWMERACAAAQAEVAARRKRSGRRRCRPVRSWAGCPSSWSSARSRTIRR